MRKTSTVVGSVIAAALLLPVATPAFAADSAEIALPDELAVVVVGDGETYANVAGPVEIELLDSMGERSGEVSLPTVTDGDQHAFTLRVDAGQAGALQQSSDHQYVTLGGYDTPVGESDTNASVAPDVLRVVASIDSAGEVDTSTSLGAAYNKRHIRGVASAAGSRFWAGGHGGDASAPFRVGVVTVERGRDAPTAGAAGGSAAGSGTVSDQAGSAAAAPAGLANTGGEFTLLVIAGFALLVLGGTVAAIAIRNRPRAAEEHSA